MKNVILILIIFLPTIIRRKIFLLIEISERNSQDASGTRPFGQPLCLGPNNGNGLDLEPPTPPSSSPSKGKPSNPLKKHVNKQKK